MKCQACCTENIYGSKSCKACAASLTRTEVGTSNPTAALYAAPAMDQAMVATVPEPQHAQNDSVTGPYSAPEAGELGFIPYTGNVQFNHFIRGLRLSLDFQGRTGRKGFWYFNLFQILILMVLQVVAKSLVDLALMVTLLPMLAIWVRRLHDIGRSGFWLFAGLIPGVNLVLIYFAVLEGHPEENAWGPAVVSLD